MARTKPTLGGKLMFPNEYLSAQEFKGRDVTLTIADINRDNLRMQDGGTEPKFVMTFEETKKKLVLNKTNATAIAAIHGHEAENWRGQRITLYPTRTLCFGEQVDCIRIREQQQPAQTPDDPLAGDELSQAA